MPILAPTAPSLSNRREQEKLCRTMAIPETGASAVGLKMERKKNERRGEPASSKTALGLNSRPLEDGELG
ncbi:hypothetical protein TNCV_189051 [Trichonephila clavipes]|nr:hypothetical protein TNCV_189051 [Trichonephila clavipes]